MSAPHPFQRPDGTIDHVAAAIGVAFSVAVGVAALWLIL